MGPFNLPRILRRKSFTWGDDAAASCGAIRVASASAGDVAGDAPVAKKAHPSAAVPAHGGIARRALAGATAATGAVLAAASLSACGDDKQKKTTGEPQVVDDKNLVSVLDEYEQVDCPYSASQTWTLPLGTVLSHAGGSWAAAITVPDSAVSPNSIAALSTASGGLTALMQTPVTGNTYVFYDARLGEGVLAWVEIEMAGRSWILYGQPFADGALSGEAKKLDEGDVDWEPPLPEVHGSSVIWQKMPLATGAKSSKDSHCRIWSVGDSDHANVCTSTGRFATAPRVSGEVLTVCPRVKGGDGTYYGMTALDLADASYRQLDQLVLPASVRPLEAIYMDEQFAFSIEAAYEGVGSLGNMGTFFGREGGPYVYLSREPVSCVAGNSGVYLVKSQSAHYVVNTKDKTYSILYAPDRCLDFGDYPATSGETSRFITYATVRDDKGLPASVTARLFSL